MKAFAIFIVGWRKNADDQKTGDAEQDTAEHQHAPQATSFRRHQKQPKHHAEFNQAVGHDIQHRPKIRLQIAMPSQRAIERVTVA